MGRQTDLLARRKDGSEVVVEIALSPLQDRGHPLVVAAIRDIGAYPRIKQALLRAALQRGAGPGRPARGRHPRSAAAARAGAGRRLRGAAGRAGDGLPARAEPARAAHRRRRRQPAGRGGRAAHPQSQRQLDRLRARTGPAGGRSPTTGARPASACPPPTWQAGLTSALAVPLSDRGRTIGVLVGPLADRAQLRRRRGALPRVAGQPADQRAAAGAVGGGAQPCPAARERRPAHRRHRPRLQQPAHGDPGQPAGARRAARRRRRRCSGASSSTPPFAPRAAAPS